MCVNSVENSMSTLLLGEEFLRRSSSSSGPLFVETVHLNGESLIQLGAEQSLKVVTTFHEYEVQIISHTCHALVCTWGCFTGPDDVSIVLLVQFVMRCAHSNRGSFLRFDL